LYPPKPKTTDCKTPPAPVKKYGLLPPFVSEKTPNGFLMNGIYDYLKFL
jgi:hypothetical protein